MKKMTINETIDYIDKNIEKRLNEISSTKIIGVYDNYFNSDSRTLQKGRVMNAAIERAPLKLEFVGKNNLGIVALFAIPYRVDSTFSNRSQSSEERIRKGYSRIAKETELKESMSALGLNNKVQKKFSKVDSIDNVFSPKDVYNSFIVYSKNETGKYKRLSPYKNIMESIANYVGYDRYDTLEENIAKFFKSNDFFVGEGCIMFDVPSDCRKFIKFICQLVNDAWRIDISRYLDWHDFMH